jgi:hypothetical protein
MMPSNIYLELTDAFNAGRLRAVICSGQAVVLHRLAIMSKDGDWILREDEETLAHVLRVLEQRNAVYRFGAPLALSWLQHGWSAHFEFQENGLRVRTDFFTRPPRMDKTAIEALWVDQAGKHPPFVGLNDLARLKLTNREKDYVVIGEIARKMKSIESQILYSRSARDLIGLKNHHSSVWLNLLPQRPALESAEQGEDALAAALDAEKRSYIKENERRLDRFERSSAQWAHQWPTLSKTIKNLKLTEAHHRLVQAARNILPYEP